ncbi:MAG: MBL fold metallo-hydrolase [Deltaproteobacteria bacterium]|nr:MBL fold metallo-hydrolase [Deltaproteobacteria bacterium]
MSGLYVTMLGCGTSTGVPVIGCPCAVCTSTDAKNRRMRASVSVEYGGRTVLFDTSTDLRQQALQFGLRRVDAVFYTHHHADHVNGIDELRAFNFLQQATIPIFANAQTMRRIERYFEHIFSDAVTAGGKANVLPTIVDGRPITVHGMTVQPIPLVHFEAEVTGYRIGPFAYLTDCKAIPETSWPLLAGVTHIILDCLRHETHISHMNVAEALEVVERLRPVRAVFTHMNHEMDYATASRALPPGVELGYDGLVIEC